MEDNYRTWLPLDLRASPRQSEAPHLLLSLECVFCPPFPQRKPFSWMQPWESNVFFETIWPLYVTEPCEGLYIKFLQFKRVAEETPKMSLVCKFPCFLNLPPTCLFLQPLPTICIPGLFENQERSVWSEEDPFSWEDTLNYIPLPAPWKISAAESCWFQASGEKQQPSSSQSRNCFSGWALH